MKHAGDDRVKIALAVGQANRVLASIEVDPLGSGTMSPTATVVPAAHRVAEGARVLADGVC